MSLRLGNSAIAVATCVRAPFNVIEFDGSCGCGERGMIDVLRQAASIRADDL